MHHLCESLRASTGKPILKHFDTFSPDLHFVIHWCQLAHEYDCMAVCSKILVILALGMLRAPLWSGHGLFGTLLECIWGPLSNVQTLYYVLTFCTPCILVKRSKNRDKNVIWWSVKKWQTAHSDLLIDQALFWPVFSNGYGMWGIDQ